MQNNENETINNNHAAIGEANNKSASNDNIAAALVGDDDNQSFTDWVESCLLNPWLMETPVRSTEPTIPDPVVVEPGVVFAGKVVKVLSFGAIIEIPGTGKTGLLHISEMFGETAEERELYKNSLFENVTRLEKVEILGVDQMAPLSGQPAPRQKESIKLSVRRPHRLAELESLGPNDTVEGRVVCKVGGRKYGKPYGVFVDLGGGVQGLLHESQVLGRTREDREKRLASLAPGCRVTVCVRNFEVHDYQKKISLRESWGCR